MTAAATVRAEASPLAGDRDGDRLPVELALGIATDWTDPFETGSSGRVRGLTDWGHDDLEVVEAPVRPGELRQVLAGLARTVLHQRRPLRDGGQVLLRGQPAPLHRAPLATGDGYALRLAWPPGVRGSVTDEFS